MFLFKKIKFVSQCMSESFYTVFDACSYWTITVNSCVIVRAHWNTNPSSGHQALLFWLQVWMVLFMSLICWVPKSYVVFGLIRFTKYKTEVRRCSCRWAVTQRVSLVKLKRCILPEHLRSTPSWATQKPGVSSGGRVIYTTKYTVL